MPSTPYERTFKKIGHAIDTAINRLDEGLGVVERLEEAEDEMERERYTELAAMHLHHSWHSMVRLFRRVARDVDNGAPRGAGAPRALIEQMFQRTPERPSMLSMQHRATVHKLAEFHRQFRNAQDVKYSRREIAELIDVLSDEIVPSVLESARILALSSPGGTELIANLYPKKGNHTMTEVEDRKIA